MLRSLRACLVALSILTCGCPSLARDVIRVDNHQSNNTGVFSVSISAQGGEYGHAFITFNKEDSTHNMTTQNTIGFYPGDLKAGKNVYSAVFTIGAGKIYDDTQHTSDVTLVVQVDSVQYANALAVFDKWNSKGVYILGFSDCTSFVGEVASAIGLKTPSRMFAPYPIDYVKGIATLKQALDEKQKSTQAQVEQQRRASAALRKKRDEAERRAAYARRDAAIAASAAWVAQRHAEDLRFDNLMKASEKASATARAKAEASAAKTRAQEKEAIARQLEGRARTIIIPPPVFPSAGPSGEDESNVPNSPLP